MRHPIRGAVLVPLIVLGGCLLWSLWPVLGTMAGRWSGGPRYSHGYFVPIFALALLWMRRSRLEGVTPRPSTWGLAFLALGAATQLVGGYFRINSIEGWALFPYLAGLCVLLGGWPVLRWAWPSIAFLFFMIPLPSRLEMALGRPLQTIATVASTYALQTLGFMAFSEGNVIQLNEARIGVVEACSGLSMLITFIALATAAALVVKRPLLDKIVLVLSSIPVALLANVARITATGMLHDLVGSEVANRFYHDLADWLMIPLALLLYWFEIWLLSHILVEKAPQAHVVVGLAGANRSTNVAAPGTKGSKLSRLGR